MAKPNSKTKGKSSASYISPMAEVLEFCAEDLLCVSGSTEDLVGEPGGWFDGTENLGNGDTTGWF